MRLELRHLSAARSWNHHLLNNVKPWSHLSGSLVSFCNLVTRSTVTLKLQSLSHYNMTRIYLASPYGFSEAGRHFLQSKLTPALQSSGYNVIDPWSISRDLGAKLDIAMREQEITRLRDSLRTINLQICNRNELAIREVDRVLA